MEIVMLVGRFEAYQDTSDEWRWRLKASNGTIIADSAEGYKAERDCLHGIELVKQLAPNARVHNLVDERNCDLLKRHALIKALLSTQPKPPTYGDLWPK
jgi:uncharacterized protein YegP (UPF0339 family)